MAEKCNAFPEVHIYAALTKYICGYCTDVSASLRHNWLLVHYKRHLRCSYQI